MDPVQNTYSPQAVQNPVYRYRPPATPLRRNTDTEAPIHNMFYNDQGVINEGADQINDEASSALEHYGARQADQEGNVDRSLEDLRNTPGYTDNEARQIDPGYAQYRTNEQDIGNTFLTPYELSGMSGNPSLGWSQAGEGTDNQFRAVNDYGQHLINSVGDYNAATREGLGTLNTGLSGAADSLDSGLNASQGKFGKLDAAVNDGGLAFDPNGTEHQMTDGDVQNIRTAAGTRVGNQYRSAEDDLYRRAAAAGNTSPLAIAAANARLQRDSAAQMGDAELSADISARQAQQDRAAQIEGQRLGANQTQAGMRANAATQEQSQAQAAAGTSGAARLNAASLAGVQAVQAGKDMGQAGIDASNNYGNANIANATNVTNQKVKAVTDADNTAAARAATQATNRQATQANANQTRYGQKMDTSTADSNAAQTVGGQRIAGNTAYRAGVAGQAANAQQGGTDAMGQQNTTLSTRTSGLNNSTAARANYENTGPGALGKMGNSLLGAFSGAASKAATAGFAAEGETATEPEMMTIGERGPEMVFSEGNRYGQMVEQPMTAMLDPGDQVVPMNNDPRNKTSLMNRYRPVAA